MTLAGGEVRWAVPAAMLRWLGVRGAGGTTPLTTEDPLAAVAGPGAHRQLYSVSRVNPVYVEQLDCAALVSARRGKQPAASSGYGSHGSEPVYVEARAGRDDALALLEHNAGLVRSLLQHASTASLTTIPEGRCCVPPPVWPPHNTTTTATATQHQDQLYDSLYSSLAAGGSRGSGTQSSRCGDAAHLPAAVFIHEDLAAVPTGLRNALMYGTLCRGAGAGAPPGKDTGGESLLAKEEQPRPRPLLQAAPQDRPSVWEIYYGAGVVEGDIRLKAKPTDQPYYPAGRPEADFTLDVGRSEVLNRRMKAAKKWRFRCRICTSLLGLVFFLLSLMAVSLLLTRGKRMFGSML